MMVPRIAIRHFIWTSEDDMWRSLVNNAQNYTLAPDPDMNWISGFAISGKQGKTLRING